MNPRIRVIRNLHSMARRVGCGEHVAGLDCAKGGIGPDLDVTAQGHIVAAFHCGQVLIFFVSIRN